MEETKAVVVAGERQIERAPKLDLSELSPQRRAYIQELRAQVMVQRGIREHCDWLSKTGGLPVSREDGQSTQMSAGTAAIAIGVGTELGFPLNVALTKVTVINNRPAIYGDVALALIRKRGLVDPKKGGGLKWWFEGVPGSDEYTAHVHAKRADTGEELACSFSIGDAKRAGLWGSRTWVKWGALRMLRYRALGFLCRDLFSDVLLGVHLAEELLGSEGGETPTSAPPMTPPPDPSAAHVVDPLWGGETGETSDGGEQSPPAVVVVAEPVLSPEGAEKTPSEPLRTPVLEAETVAAGSSAPPASVEPPPSAPTPLSAPQTASAPPPPETSAATAVDVDERGRVVLERDAQGRPVVYAKERTPSSTVTKVVNGKGKPEPAPAPAAPAPVDDDDDVAKVKAAIAAAKARMTKPAPTSATKPQGAPVQKGGALFEE